MWGFGGHAGESDARLIHELAQAGIKIIHGEGWWNNNVSNPLDIYYNETIRTFAKEAINESLYGILPSYAGGPEQFAYPIAKDDIWAICLGDEEPAWLRQSEIYGSVSPQIGQYNATYNDETGFYMKPIYGMNDSERYTFIEWLNEKTIWVYNYMYDYVKSQVPHALIMQYVMMPPIWGLSDELCSAYELKAEIHAMDCYYAFDNPWLLHEGIRLYKTSIPNKPLHWDLWGTIWDFLNEAGDGEYYKIGSFEQIRRETWVSYLSGADVIGYFDWAPENNDSYVWKFGHARTDNLGRQIWRYIDNLAGQLSYLPVMEPAPRALVIGNGYYPNVAQAGLFTEYDIVNHRYFATMDLDLSCYSLLVVTDDWYLDDTVRKVNEYVESGGNAIFLGGIYAKDGIQRNEIFSIEENLTESYIQGKMLINITEPNVLDLKMEFDIPYHVTYLFPGENLTEDHHSIGGFYTIDEDDNATLLTDSPLLLYHNSSRPDSGWMLYFGLRYLSEVPGDTWYTFDPDERDALHSLYRQVVRAFATYIDATDSVSTPETEHALITQAKVNAYTILAGVCNFEDSSRTIPYTLDLSRFGFPDGNYWIHSLDENASLGSVASSGQRLSFDVNVAANGTRLLLLSETKSLPSYSIDIFPSLPDMSDSTTTDTTASTDATTETTTRLQIGEIFVQYISIAGGILVGGVVLIAIVFLTKEKLQTR